MKIGTIYGHCDVEDKIGIQVVEGDPGFEDYIRLEIGDISIFPENVDQVVELADKLEMFLSEQHLDERQREEITTAWRNREG
jgi:hypothetical protein